MRVNVAHNWGEFLDALKLYQTPTQNFAYADVDGDIGFISPGLLPLRKSGDGLAPVDGASGAADWTGVMTFDQAPQLHNPAVGFIFNANNAIVGPDKAAQYGRDWEETFRARRIQQYFDANPKLSLDLSAAMQADRLSLDVGDLKPFLKKRGAERRARPTGAGAARRLERRDGQGSAGAADLHRVPPRAASHHAGRQDRPVAERERAVRRRDAGGAAARPSRMVRRARQARPRLPRDARPGARRRAGRAGQPRRRRHEPVALGQGACRAAQAQGLQPHPAARSDQRSQPAVETAASMRSTAAAASTRRPTSPTPAPTAAAIARSTISATPTSRASSSPPAKSGHIFSPHYRDLAPLWIAGKSITLAGDEAALKRAGAQELTFTPK